MFRLLSMPWLELFLRRRERRFRREMAESKTLGEAILVPQVYTDLNTRYILVTEWVEGVKVRFCS